MAFAVWDPIEGLKSVESDLNDAIGVAKESRLPIEMELLPDPEHEVVLSSSDLAGLAGKYDSVPASAYRASGFAAKFPHGVSMAEVRSMSLEDAHRRLFPFFKGLVAPRAGAIAERSYDTPAKMSSSILGQNYKTAKDHPEEPSKVLGLSLVPHSLISKRRSELGVNGPRFGDYGQVQTLCFGSNEACQRTCLVYAGHNVLDYNQQVKVARTEALINEPIAFIRMIDDAVRKHGVASKKTHVKPYIRLNVFQDVPWELLCPELFTEHSSMNFYDYTKVVGRNPPSNYDLTFSYSGSNHQKVDYELSRGRRVAVVFLLPGGLKTRRVSPLPTSWMGYQVVDGDVSDLRPLDPAPCVVGLRYKNAQGKGEDPRDVELKTFIVEVEQLDGQYVTATAASSEPIVDADGVPKE